MCLIGHIFQTTTVYMRSICSVNWRDYLVQVPRAGTDSLLVCNPKLTLS